MAEELDVVQLQRPMYSSGRVRAHDDDEESTKSYTAHGMAVQSTAHQPYARKLNSPYPTYSLPFTVLGRFFKFLYDLRKSLFRIFALYVANPKHS